MAVSMILRTSTDAQVRLPSNRRTEPDGIIRSFASKHTISKTSEGSDAIFDLKYFTSLEIVPISVVGVSSSFEWYAVIRFFSSEIPSAAVSPIPETSVSSSSGASIIPRMLPNFFSNAFAAGFTSTRGRRYVSRSSICS